ncbi:cupin domain-containing protein [Streptomyces sp. NBC_00053]|uniref:JmjC domain-containing protein n=1 Tax=unclassified Streptomyces TaxID=2593676 RepID=UPI000F5C1FB6|nr:MULTISPECIES: cupin domain-containing protein [unclassified Streptomyces]WSG55461.1 cupin domain-containing protein [Streptomyces sp. NBC_01732]WSX06599.1 cupin domain-containing protein [Streptomyces sp. NBC_00987]MCX4391526.1 cupin domain-containing protein [Streptomyces sp. NBC_01767]MCX5498072.1 cupin domain-containing protein [Streptomyces sp. NBC_00052]MCX5553396.1 cupin domain-containing protein [Streptomyces sp. NBC_00051]
MDWLERCVPDVEQLLGTYWRKEPLLLRPQNPPLEVLTLSDVDALLGAGLLRVPYIGLYTAQGSIADERFCPMRVITGNPVQGYVDAAAVRRLIDEERATLQFRYVDQWHPPVRELTRGVAERLGRLVEAFFFLSRPGRRGPVHRDDGDLLAIQLSGAKHWQVYAGPPDGDWAPVREENPGAPLLDTVLEAGEVLYVPRGFAHTATAVGDASSAHLTVVVREAGAEHLRAALLAGIVDGLTLPGRPLDDDALLRTAAELLDHLGARLDAVTPDDVIGRARPRAYSNRQTV